MAGGAPANERLTGDAHDLLRMVFARPKEALAAARDLLAGAPDPYDAAIAHQAIGTVLRDFGDAEAGLAELRRALALARRSGSADREADVQATLGIALVRSGHSARGLATLNRAVTRSEGITGARVRFRRGCVLWILGRHREALDDLRRAVPVLRRAADTIWTGRALTLRALIYLAMGSVERANRDFRTAERLFATTQQEHDSVVAMHNQGLVAFHSGDLPAALALFDEVARRYQALGTPMPELTIDRCGVLLAAGLARDALGAADAAIRSLERRRGRATIRAELLLTAARAALAAEDPATALARAEVAARLVSAQRRDWWGAHARLVILQARLAAGPSGRLLRAASRTAEHLAGLRSPEAAHAYLVAGRAALALGRLAEADGHLAAAARVRHRGSALSRVGGWLAEALRARANGQRPRMLGACRRGLDILDEHRLMLGSSELRAQASAHGAELALLAQRACLAGGRARDLLAWSERQRAAALAVPPVRPPHDSELQAAMTAFREITRRLEARAEDVPYDGLKRRQRQLERQIRARTMHVRRPGGGNGRRLDIRALLDEIGTGRLVEIVEVDGALHVLLCGSGRVRRLAAGPKAAAAAEVEFARAALRQLAYDRSPADDSYDVIGSRLERTLLGPAARLLGDGPVVIVPPSRFHGVPWALLPSLHDRVVSVAPSASAWLRARLAAPPPGRSVVLVRGPGLGSDGAEVPRIAAAYGAGDTAEPRSGAGPGTTTVLEGSAATAARTLAAIDGSRLAHIAAHGSFRADSPLFSTLRMADGPLTVFDFERLWRAPHRLILPSCDSGRLAPVGADELLGLAAALLPLGTAGIVASLVPVNDAATVALMLALHRRLGRGAELPEALRDARCALPDDPVHRATGSSFIAIGAG